MRKIKLMLFLMLFILTGCLSYSEINNIGIINSIGIDKQNNNYILSINILTPQKDNLKNKKTYIIESKTISNAFDKLYLISTKKINLSHLELLVLSPNLNKNDYDEIISFFINRNDSRNTFDTVLLNNYNQDNITKYTEEDILSLIKTNQEEDGITSNLTFDNLVKDILNYDIAYIPVIEIKDKIEILGYRTIYNQNKLLNKEESMAYNYINNKITSCNLTLDDYTYIKVKSNYTSIHINKNTINIVINSNIEGNINQYKNIIMQYINNFIDNNNLNFLANLIKKYNFNYYKNNNNIKPIFKIEIIAGDNDE